MGQRFQVGDRAPESGTYRVRHRGHRDDHNVIVVRGDEFPACRYCKSAPTFILEDAADYIAHDLDFAGTSLPKIA
jgi:hypothetical protein